jgi:hypothetical protein
VISKEIAFSIQQSDFPESSAAFIVTKKEPGSKAEVITTSKICSPLSIL